MPLQVLIEIPRVILNKVGVAANPGVLIALLIRESKLLNGVCPLNPRPLVVSRGQFILGVQLVPHSCKIGIIVVRSTGNSLLDHAERERKFHALRFDRPTDRIPVNHRQRRIRVRLTHALVVEHPPVLLNRRLAIVIPPHGVVRVNPKLKHTALRVNIILRQLRTVNLRDHA